MEWNAYGDVLGCISSRTGQPAPSSYDEIVESVLHTQHGFSLDDRTPGGFGAFLDDLTTHHQFAAEDADSRELLWRLLTLEFDGGYVFTTSDGAKWLAADPAAQPGHWIRYKRLPEAFYAAEEQRARTVLEAIGAGLESHGADVVVVPDEGFQLGAGNSAITVKTSAQARLYRQSVDAVTSKDEWDGRVDAQQIQERIRENVILLKLSVLSSPDFEGILWHEWGHVVHGPTESGNVFALELGAVLEHKGLEEARAWCRRNDRLKYILSTAVEPGIEELKAVTARILPPDAMNRVTDGLTQRQTKKPAPKRSAAPSNAPITVGDRISGSLFQLTQRIGPSARGKSFMGNPVAGGRVRLADLPWKVVEVSETGGEATYTLELL